LYKIKEEPTENIKLEILRIH